MKNDDTSAASSQMITPTLWMNRTADDAAEFYTTAFRGIGVAAQVSGRLTYPDPMDFYLPEFAGQTRVKFVQISNLTIGLINAADEHTPNPSISFLLNFDPSTMPNAEEQLNQLWDVLCDGGHVLMEVQEYPFSKRFGWVEDKYGVSWQLMLTSPEGNPRPFAMPYFLFSGSHQDEAAAAMDFYVDLFPNSQVGKRIFYQDNSKRVMFADAQLAGQWMVLNDSGIEQPFSFNEGVSMFLMAHDAEQAEYFHEKLSHRPEKDNYGWCEDRFGVTWQIGYEGMEGL